MNQGQLFIWYFLKRLNYLLLFLQSIVFYMNKKVNREIKKSTAKNINISLHVTENVGLMNFLIAKMPNNSRNKIKSLLGNKQVLVDGQVISQFNHGLVPGQKIEISKNRVEPEKRSREFTIVFEDNDLVVIEKQAGLLSISTEKEKRYTAYSLLSDQIGRAHV